MRRKRALIVDDSETARAVLAGKLRKFEIEVDTRDSAAAAIDYLYENTPDAVFLDYEMPGMDGFQALKVIKSNPNTATIPVMMYTSKEGGLELSQARALGAVGVLPKHLEPQDLSAVVKTLRLGKDDEAEHRLGDDKIAELPIGRSGRSAAANEPAALALEDAIGLPGEVYEESEYNLRRIVSVCRKEVGKTEKRLVEFVSREMSAIRRDLYGIGQLNRESAASGRLGSILVGFILLFIAAMGVFWLDDLVQENRDLNGRIALIEKGLGDIHQEVTLLGQLMESGAYGPEQEAAMQQAGNPALISFKGLIEWALNQGPVFAFGESPFSEGRVLWLSELVGRLVEAGFSGKLTLKANLGDFCLIKDAAGAYVLANNDMDLTDCLFRNQIEQRVGLFSAEQSLGFANYVNSLAAENGGRLEVVVDEVPAFQVLYPYPDRYAVKTAGEWNQVALRNQRILITLSHPDWQ